MAVHYGETHAASNLWDNLYGIARKERSKLGGLLNTQLLNSNRAPDFRKHLGNAGRSRRVGHKCGNQTVMETILT